MLGMIKKDFLMIKSNTKTIIACLLIYVFYSLMFEMNMSFIFPFMSIIVCISTFSYDDYNNWHLYVASLPDGRKNAVKSKYITATSLVIITSIIGSILSMIIENYRDEFILDENISFNMGILFAIFIMISLLFPFLFKYGAEKGRIVMMLLGIGIMGIFVLFTKVVHLDMPSEIISSLNSYIPILFVITSAVMLLISYSISKKCYLKREL